MMRLLYKIECIMLQEKLCITVFVYVMVENFLYVLDSSC